MTKQSPTIVFFGNERLATGVTTAAPTLRALVDGGYDVAAVILNNDAAVSRSTRQLEIAQVAAGYGIPVHYPASLKEFLPELQKLQADIGVLVAYGRMVPDPVIELFPHGIVNIHPSALPLHRGPTPLESVILSGESETAVSLMQLVKAMDAGPVYAQRTTPVPEFVSKQALADQLLEIGSKLLVHSLPDILSGRLKPQPQDDSQATYDSLITKSDNRLDWSKPASELERQVRAYGGWPKSTAHLGEHRLIVHQAAVVKTSGKPGEIQRGKNQLLVFCGQDALSLVRVQPVNKKEMPITAFLAGYKL